MRLLIITNSPAPPTIYHRGPQDVVVLTGHTQTPPAIVTTAVQHAVGQGIGSITRASDLQGGLTADTIPSVIYWRCVLMCDL